MKATVLLLISMILLAAPGCGGGDDGTPARDASDPMAFCRGAAGLQCARMYTCLTQAERDARELPPTQAECERAFESACERGLDSCIDDTHDYAPAAGATCLDEMSRATCNDAGEPFLDVAACRQACARTAGAFRLAWTFQPFYGCEQLDIAWVTLIATDTTGHNHVTSFACSEWSGTTDVLPADDYQLRVELANASGQRVWSTERGARALDAAVVDLGELVIPVSS